MSLGKFKKLVFTFAILISFQCVAAAFLSEDSHAPDTSGIHAQHHQSVFTSFLFEKTAEEEERDKFVAIELVDFSQIAVLLAQVYTPHIHHTPFEQRVETDIELFELHCVFRI
jgi:hypothetical protein